AFESAATKIRAILRHGQKQKTELLTERIQIRNTGVGQITFPRSSSNLTLIQKAITDYRLLELYYQSLEGEQTQRLIEPFALYSTQGNWIMVAYCRTRKDWRSFRLDHIQSVKTGASFEPHNITLEEYFELCRQKYLNTPDIPLAQPTDSFAVNSKNLIMKTVTKQAFKIVGMGIRTTNENGQAMKDLGELWGNFQPAEVAAKIPNRVSDTFYGVYTNYESDHNRPYDALIGFEVSDFNNVPEGMVAKQMEGGTFALITAKGDMRKGEPIAKAWNDINQKDLARAFTNDFEVYDQRAANPADAEVDILVALK
ncbi:MAG: effector binding domain-containing protein, partial [Owenweeksia sp.]